MVARKKATKSKVASVAKKSTTAKKATRVKVKKSAPRKTATKTTSSKKSLGKVSKPFTKGELLTTIAERTGLQRKEVSSILEELVAIIEAHLKKGGPEQFTLPGVLKMTVKKSPAKKARKGINPFTGEPTVFKAKPASRKVKIAALKKLKEMVA